MRKKLPLCVLTIAMINMFSGQVGVNTDAPKATFDITAKTTNGSIPEGLIAPRLTGDQIKSADDQYSWFHGGAIAYITKPVTIPSSKTAGITETGYYYFDGYVWQPFCKGEEEYLVVDCKASTLEEFVYPFNPLNPLYPNNVNFKFSVIITNNSFTTANITFQPSDLEAYATDGVAVITVDLVTPTSVSLNPGQSQVVEYLLDGPYDHYNLVARFRKRHLRCVKNYIVACCDNKK